MAKPTPAKPAIQPGPVFASLSGRRLRRPDGRPDYRKPTPWLPARRRHAVPARGIPLSPHQKYRSLISTVSPGCILVSGVASMRIRRPLASRRLR